MKKLTYSTSTIVWLRLEHFHNAGLSPEKTREVIERMWDPGLNGRRLQCNPSGVNSNWNVSTFLIHPESISDLVFNIEVALEVELKIMKKAA